MGLVSLQVPCVLLSVLWLCSRGSGSWQPPVVFWRFLQGPLCLCPASLPSRGPDIPRGPHTRWKLSLVLRANPHTEPSRLAVSSSGPSHWPLAAPPEPGGALRVPLLPSGACVRCPCWARGFCLESFRVLLSAQTLAPECGRHACVLVCVVGECTRGRGRGVWGAWICVWSRPDFRQDFVFPPWKEVAC